MLNPSPWSPEERTLNVRRRRSLFIHFLTLFPFSNLLPYSTQDLPWAHPTNGEQCHRTTTTSLSARARTRSEPSSLSLPPSSSRDSSLPAPYPPASSTCHTRSCSGGSRSSRSRSTSTNLKKSTAWMNSCTAETVRSRKKLASKVSGALR